jgi:hypothetical protein
MKIILKVLLCELVFVAVCTSKAQAPQGSGRQEPPLSLAAKPVKDVVEAGSPVDIEVTVTNNSNRALTYQTWGVMDFLKFDVRDEAGSPALTRRGRALLLGEGLGPGDVPHGSQHGELVEPGKSIEVKERVPADLFDLTKPGKYTVQVLQPWTSESLRSNTVTVTVVEGATPYVAPVPVPPISVTIRPVGGSSVPSGGQVTLEVTTKNISKHWTNQRTASDKRGLQRFFRVDVQDSQGGTPPETDFGRSVGNRGDVPPKYQAGHEDAGRWDVVGATYNLGEERTQGVSVSDLYDLSKPGQYTIQVRRWDDETKTWVKSNTITVTVTP